MKLRNKPLTHLFCASICCGRRWKRSIFLPRQSRSSLINRNQRRARRLSLVTHMWVIFLRLEKECFSSFCSVTSTEMYLKETHLIEATATQLFLLTFACLCAGWQEGFKTCFHKRTRPKKEMIPIPAHNSNLSSHL